LINFSTNDVLVKQEGFTKLVVEATDDDEDIEEAGEDKIDDGEDDIEFTGDDDEQGVSIFRWVFDLLDVLALVVWEYGYGENVSNSSIYSIAAFNVSTLLSFLDVLTIWPLLFVLECGKYFCNCEK
jgi:hypothetical protein